MFLRRLRPLNLGSKSSLFGLVQRSQAVCADRHSLLYTLERHRVLGQVGHKAAIGVALGKAHRMTVLGILATNFAALRHLELPFVERIESSVQIKIAHVRAELY